MQPPKVTATASPWFLGVGKNLVVRKCSRTMDRPDKCSNRSTDLTLCGGHLLQSVTAAIAELWVLAMQGVLEVKSTANHEGIYP
jgi:hypothetical protein